MNQDLIRDLEQADMVARGVSICSICAIITDPSRDKATREAIRAAASAESRIGLNKLVTIFGRHELGVGVRTLRRHREEGHTP